MGYVVIDHLVQGSSYGGVRIVPEISLLELQHTARSMTYKNAFIGNKAGGAKAAVIIDRNNEQYKKEILTEFGKSISPIVRNGLYFPVMDMGIQIQDLQIIFDNTKTRTNVLSWKNLSHVYTAYSCLYATLSALQVLEEIHNLNNKDVTFCVQGYGKVGSLYSYLMYKAGAKFTGFSNKYFGVMDDNGLDAEKLFNEQLKRGDDFILDLKDKQVSHDSILEKDVNVLLLASNALVINEKNYKKIRADIIVCAANAPVSYDIERKLFKEGKMVVTDFIANCGGILGSIMDTYLSEDAVKKILSSSYKRKVTTLIYQSINQDTAIIDLVIDELQKRIDSNYDDTYIQKGFTEHIIDLFNEFSLPLYMFTNNFLEKKYVSRYEKFWGPKI
ncbi:NADP(+)-dependent glutamate dehydrogenase [uncultured archaeon]|nr:NADP(+)-dependent glutamate dehydrogenase [uncultured archaeon]